MSAIATFLKALFQEAALLLAGFLTVVSLVAFGLHIAHIQASGPYVAYAILFTALFSAAFGALYGVSRRPGCRQAVASGLSVFCISCAFFLLVPVTIERSISVFLLEHMLSEAGSYSDAQLLAALKGEYICHTGAITKRMQEQAYIGNVASLPDNRFTLTPRGRWIAGMLQPAGEFFSVPSGKAGCGAP